MMAVTGTSGRARARVEGGEGFVPSSSLREQMG